VGKKNDLMEKLLDIAGDSLGGPYELTEIAMAIAAESAHPDADAAWSIVNQLKFMLGDSDDYVTLADEEFYECCGLILDYIGDTETLAKIKA
jgi:hypothetical protein